MNPGSLSNGSDTTMSTSISSRDDRSFSAPALLVAGAFFMEFLDGTVIATALPDMAKDFGVTAVDLNIGISAYLITLAVLGNDSNLLIVFYVQIMPDDFVMQLHRF